MSLKRPFVPKSDANQRFTTTTTTTAIDKTVPHYVLFAIALKQVSVTIPHVQKWPKLQTKTHVDLINIPILIPG